MCQSVEIFCCCSLYGNVSWFFLQRVFIFFERVHRQAHGRYLKGILVALSRRCSCTSHTVSHQFLTKRLSLNLLEQLMSYQYSVTAHEHTTLNGQNL